MLILNDRLYTCTCIINISQRCSGGLISDESTPVCSACTSLRGSASDGKSSTMQITVHPKTPLSRLSKEDLIKEVKASRYCLREIQAQVQSLTNSTYKPVCLNR